MKKRTKIILGVLTSLLIITLIGLGFVGNYLYDLALNPNTDKDMIFNNEDTENQEHFEVEDTFFKDVAFEEYNIENDGLQLHAYDFYQNSNTYVIVIHGYTSQGLEMGISTKHFYDMGYNVLVPDLRGHGLSEGDYIGMGWDERLDIIAWIDLLEEKDDYNIILYGVSMGAATLMNTIGENLPDSVKLAIEDCGYTSTWDIFAYQLDSLFSLPATPFMDAANVITGIRAGYNLKEGPINQIKNATIPILFIHGDADTFVPFSMLDELYDAAPNPKEKLVIKGAGHGQAYLVDSETYWNTVDSFIQKYITR